VNLESFRLFCATRYLRVGRPAPAHESRVGQFKNSSETASEKIKFAPEFDARYFTRPTLCGQGYSGVSGPTGYSGYPSSSSSSSTLNTDPARHLGAIDSEGRPSMREVQFDCVEVTERQREFRGSEGDTVDNDLEVPARKQLYEDKLNKQIISSTDKLSPSLPHDLSDEDDSIFDYDPVTGFSRTSGKQLLGLPIRNVELKTLLNIQNDDDEYHVHASPKNQSGAQEAADSLKNLFPRKLLGEALRRADARKGLAGSSNVDNNNRNISDNQYHSNYNSNYNGNYNNNSVYHSLADFHSHAAVKRIAATLPECAQSNVEFLFQMAHLKIMGHSTEEHLHTSSPYSWSQKLFRHVSATSKNWQKSLQEAVDGAWRYRKLVYYLLVSQLIDNINIIIRS
jgi:hypothetical protein